MGSAVSSLRTALAGDLPSPRFAASALAVPSGTTPEPHPRRPASAKPRGRYRRRRRQKSCRSPGARRPRPAAPALPGASVSIASASIPASRRTASALAMAARRFWSAGRRPDYRSAQHDASRVSPRSPRPYRRCGRGAMLLSSHLGRPGRAARKIPVRGAELIPFRQGAEPFPEPSFWPRRKRKRAAAFGFPLHGSPPSGQEQSCARDHSRRKSSSLSIHHWHARNAGGCHLLRHRPASLVCVSQDVRQCQSSEPHGSIACGGHRTVRSSLRPR